MSEVIQKITGKTMIPVSLVVMLFGGGSWMTMQNVTAKENAAAIKEMKDDIEELKTINDKISEIREDIGYIKGKLSQKHEK